MYVGTHARERPDAPAQIMASTGAVTTYRELDDGSNRLAQLLHAQGLRVGDHYAVFMENHPRFLEACWAGDRSGLYYTTVNSYLTAGEVAYIVNDCGARVLVSSSARRDVAARLPELCPGVERFLMVGDPTPGWESYDEAVAAHPAEELPRTVSGWSMLYSSGTTGQPKGILRPLPGVHPDEPHTFEGILRGLYDIDEHCVYLSPAPLYHSAPLGFCLGVQRIGGTVVVMERFDAEQALALIERYHVTHSQWVPTMFSRMLKLPAEVRARHDLSSLRYAIHASAPCPVPMKQTMFDWWGPIVYEYYGGTETNGLTFIRPEEWLTHPGSVGRALLGELHILDEVGRELPHGESGTIYFSNGMDFEYHNDPGKTAEAYDGSGRSTIGDVGYVDDEGYLYLTDRKAFMIISGGVNIYPQEAENVLVTHPKVLDVAVIGVPDDDMGEAVKAVVQLVDGFDPSPDVEQELITFCREHLAAYKCPRSVDFEAELPRLPTGKLYKRGLRDRYWIPREQQQEAPA
jgi:acyl-CoA synthetase (AMP-forming)/AMP-acid ligase II